MGFDNGISGACSVTRGTGKTLAMVKALQPNSIIIIHHPQMSFYLRDMIINVRGAEFFKTIEIKALNERTIMELRGFPGSIVCDHWVHERAKSDLSRSEFEALYELDTFLHTRPQVK